MSLGDQRNKRRLYSKAIDEICFAVGELARNKTGALIVISRTTKLDEIAETGIMINSDVNSFLIRNIFYDKAPLHDGAMIIRNFRIHSAGCFLPLSQKNDITKDLGTRHRAAIGMSENSDAVVIVVSEETGTISIAVDGKLRRNYDYNSLKQTLIKYLYDDNGKKKENASVSAQG
jgi:diadenylate cyclase